MVWGDTSILLFDRTRFKFRRFFKSALLRGRGQLIGLIALTIASSRQEYSANNWEKGPIICKRRSDAFFLSLIGADHFI
jgi:hypothetical protein